MGDIRQLYPDGPPYDGYRCDCGETWFDLTVVIGSDRRVNGWQTDATCTSCGKPVPIRGWTQHDD